MSVTQTDFEIRDGYFDDLEEEHVENPELEELRAAQGDEEVYDLCFD